MRLSNIKVEQVTINHTIVDDYGEILSKSELNKVFIDNFKNIKIAHNAIYGEINSSKYCIFCKNISYLGTPHPFYKKRIQIPQSFKKLYYENKDKGIKTLLIGVYKYHETLLFCDFDTTKYINNKSHNSSAHVHSIDLLNGVRNGYFSKKDTRGNVITVFDKNNIDKYLNTKLFGINLTFELFDTLDDFFNNMAKEWFGTEVYLEMIENNYRNKYQPEWPGFYLEYKLERYLNDHDKKSIITFYQNRKKGGIDLDLKFPQLGYYGDLKAHSINSSGIQGNDYTTVMDLLENQSIYYIVANHDTEKDKDHNYVVTTFWNKQQNKSNLMSYANKMKYSVKIKSYYVLELNKYNKKYIGIYHQGKNSDGNPRNPKINISMKNINNFLVHIVEFDEKIDE